MVDNVSQSYSIAIMIMVAGALLATVVGVLTMCNLILNGFSDKAVAGTSSATEGTIVSITGVDDVAMPIVYSACERSIGTIDFIYIAEWDDTMYDVVDWDLNTITNTYSAELIYDWKNPDVQDQVSLLSKYHSKCAQIKLIPSETTSGFNTVFIAWKE